ncbi:hypothetical protein [Hymenobacter coalescens]
MVKRLRKKLAKKIEARAVAAKIITQVHDAEFERDVNAPQA